MGFWRLNIQSGVFVWAPSPTAAEVVIEQRRRALIKRQESTPVFVCPRLLFLEWSKQLYKAADLVVVLSAGIDPGWPKKMLEPLTIGYVFPFLICKSRKQKDSLKMLHLKDHVWNVERTGSGRKQ
jgi:hypothetical protein